MVVALTFLAIAAMAMRVSVVNDTWWHLRAGEWMLENRQIVEVDRFSHTRLGEPWIYPGWLSQLLMIGLYRGGGLPGLNLLTVAAVLAAFAAIWRTSDEPPLFKAFVFVLGATASGVYWSARPQILSFAMTGVFYWSLRRAQKIGPRALWLPPLLVAVWSNLHGGFAIGFILLGIELVSNALDRYLPAGWRIAAPEQSALQTRHLVAAVGLCLAAVSLNPHGPQLLGYPFQTVSIATLQNYIQEWQSPNFHQIELLPFLAMLLLAGGAMGLSPNRPSWRELLTAGTFAALALTAARNVALFGLLATPILARHGYAVIADRIPEQSPGTQLAPRAARALNLVLVALFAFAAVLKSVEPLTPSANQAALERQVPVSAADYIDQHRPPGPIFNSYNWGSYLLWELYPEYPSFVDGRTDLFNDEILDQYLQIWRADPGWEQQLESWDIRLALVEPDAPVAKELTAIGWDTLYRDNAAVVLAAGER